MTGRAVAPQIVCDLLLVTDETDVARGREDRHGRIGVASLAAAAQVGRAGVRREDRVVTRNALIRHLMVADVAVGAAPRCQRHGRGVTRTAGNRVVLHVAKGEVPDLGSLEDRRANDGAYQELPRERLRDVALVTGLLLRSSVVARLAIVDRSDQHGAVLLRAVVARRAAKGAVHPV